MVHLTRRELLGGAIASAAALTCRGQAAAVQPDLTPFPYSAVQLLGGPGKDQFDTNHKFFLNLSEDRMLKIYRQRVGLPAPGPDMGGWYDDFCPGAHFGQYLSALARFAGTTGDEATRAKVKRLVRGLGETMDPTGKFFVDLRYPGYTYDKIVIGLLDAHSWAGDDNAIPVLYRTTKAARPHMAEKALTPEEAQARPHKDETYTWDETYTFAENLFLAYERTGDRMFFDMAKPYLLDRGFFDPLAENQDVLPGLHAYSHVNALGSGLQGYMKLGDAKYMRAVTNAVDMIWKDQSFATGGWGPNEAFVTPGKGELGASLAETHRGFETPCGAYAHFKAMRYLLALTRDPRYSDSMEQVMYNTVMGAWPIQEDGHSFYYSDYHYSAKKVYRTSIPGSNYRWDKDGRWPCCSGTLPQDAADYGINSYLRSRDGLYVNLYLPSRLAWTMGSSRCVLTQETGYPTENLVTLRLNLSAPREFTVHLRVPAWAGPGTSVEVNGKRITPGPAAGSFFALRRTWKTGDRIELELDQRARLQPIDAQNPDQAALVRGPQVLFAIADGQPKVPRAELERFQLARAQANDWTIEVSGSKFLLRPFAYIGPEVYQTYWKLT